MGEDSAARIACVGDSITWGACILHRKRDCYPARLQRLLGDGVVVGNFGMVSHTLQDSGDYPYTRCKPYRRSGEFAPDFVLVMLGTNDSKANNWRGPAPFLDDYRRLVAHYRALPSSPRVFVMTPPAVYGHGKAGKMKYTVSPEAIDQMGTVVRELAHDEGLGLIEAHAVTSGHPKLFWYDGVHPNAVGAGLIAQAAYEALAPETASR